MAELMSTYRRTRASFLRALNYIAPVLFLALLSLAVPETAYAQRGGAGTSSSARRTPPSRAAARAPVRRAPVFTSPRSASQLNADLNHFISTATRSGKWGAIVVSLTRGDTLFSWRADSAMMPASTMKLFTAAVAFERLGPTHTFSTDVLRSGIIGMDGVLDGDLVIRGDGDPSLSPRFIGGGPQGAMTRLAEFTAGAGITRVTGDLIADATGFEERRIPEGWRPRNLGYSFAAPYSALSLNENIVIVGVTPGRVGETAQAFLEPEARGIKIVSTVKTIAGRNARITARTNGNSEVLVSGTVGAANPVMRYQLVVDDPIVFTAGAFRAALEEKGITVAGDIRVGSTPDNATVVTGIASPPLSRMVSVMNRESINHYAEMIWRNAARGADRIYLGTSEMAAETLNEFLMHRVGVTSDAVVATDGSGLSVLDRVTPRSLVQLLSYASQASWGPAFHASLPVAGVSELLRTRMRTTPAVGNLHAKTGTTDDIISLAGYVTAENGELIAFSLLYNGTDRWYARETIDAIGPTLAAFSRD